MPQVDPEVEQPSPITSPTKKGPDAEFEAFLHPEVQGTVDDYDDLQELVADRHQEADTRHTSDEDFRHEFVPYCG